MHGTKLCRSVTKRNRLPSTMSNSFFSGPKPSALHALVDFGDEGTTIVLFSRIVGGSTEMGRCSVKWPDGKEYNAHPLITNEGTYFLLNAHYPYISLHAIVATCNNGYRSVDDLFVARMQWFLCTYVRSHCCRVRA